MDQQNNEDLDQLYMNYALQEAEKARTKDEVPVGAIVVKAGDVIGRGYNQKETYNNPTYHAEILAIKEACICLNNWRLIGCTIYTTLEPCIMCVGAILHARIQRVVYGCNDLKWGGLGTIVNLNEVKGLNHRLKTTSGVLENKCVELLTTFFQQKRKG